MSFSDTLRRLDGVIMSRQPGEQAETCRVRRQDLRELLHHFRRMDDEARRNPPPGHRLGSLSRRLRDQLQSAGIEISGDILHDCLALAAKEDSHGHDTRQLSSEAAQPVPSGTGSPASQRPSGNAVGNTGPDLRGRPGADDGSGNPDIGHSSRSLKGTPFSKTAGLNDLIEKSKAKLAAMSEEERQAMWQAQRESFVRAMTTPCEHGVLDFEQCPQCRAPAPSELVMGYQDRVAAAHHALFHDDPTDIAERLARYAEETNEVLQAFGMSREDMHRLVDYTCDRPAGAPAKEIGAALLTLTSLCVVAGYDVMACGEADLEKLQRPETIARIRAKRSTRHGRGPLPGIDPSARVVFGLEAQGHIPTVEAMLAEGQDWKEIGRRIGWDGETAKQYYERHLARAALSSPMEGGDNG